jgi:hypothetical protein
VIRFRPTYTNPGYWLRFHSAATPDHLLKVNISDVLGPYLIQIWPNEFAEVGWPPVSFFSVEELERLWPSGSVMEIDVPPEF